MTSPIADTVYACAACPRQYLAPPLQCECGSREFTAVTLRRTMGGFGVDVSAKVWRAK